MLTSTHLDRRRCPRYQYEGEVRFERPGQDGVARLGFGVTEDVSQRALRFRPAERLEPGAELVMRIAWPARLQNTCELELLVRGLVTRVSAGGTVVTIRDYEFRTCGARSFWETPEPASNCRVVA